MSNSWQRLLSDGQRLLSDIQRLSNDVSSADNMFAPHSAINAGTSISQVMGDICAPRELSGFPAMNILETPENYELQSELPDIDKDSIKIEVPDSHTLTMLGRVQEDDGSAKKEDKMEEDPISTVAAETQQESIQAETVQDLSAESGCKHASAARPGNSPLKPTQKSKKPVWWTNERVLGSFGNFRRSFFFLDPITIDGAAATIKNGVIKIVLQKAQDVKSNIKLIYLED